MLETSTGEIEQRSFGHGDGESERYYRQLQAPALIGMEAIGNSLWFERLMEQLGHELWIGDAAQIRASYTRRQKTDRRDAGHILRLLVEQRFPRIWIPSAARRDVRQLLLHRHKLVQMRTRVKTELQRGPRRQVFVAEVRASGAEPGDAEKAPVVERSGRADFKNLPLEGWTGRRREDLLAVLAIWRARWRSWTGAVEEVAAGDGQARLLMTQPGAGPVTALAFVVTIGDVRRFQRGKKVASYLVLIPAERSSGDKRRLGSISKQGNMFLRTLLVEAAQSAVRYDEEFRREYRHRCHQKPTGVAKVAAARKLAVRLYWMLRTQTPYRPAAHNEGSPGHSVVG